MSSPFTTTTTTTTTKNDEASYRHRRSVQAREAKPVVVEKARSAATESAMTTPRDINYRADDFIRRFRQQLQLQRVESLENYRQMLERGL